jgi:hypothetical protein
VTTLVGTDGYTVRVFLDGSSHDIVDTPVVAEMDDFRPLRLDQSTHNVDRRVMAIEQRSGGNEAQRWFLGFARSFGQVACGGLRRKFPLIMGKFF